MTLQQAEQLNSQIITQFSDYYRLDECSRRITLNIHISELLHTTQSCILLFTNEVVTIALSKRYAASQYCDANFDNYSYKDFTEQSYTEFIRKFLTEQSAIISQQLKIIEQISINNLLTEINNL